MSWAVSGVCFDLYSTLAHEAPDNPFYRDVAACLDLDYEPWHAAYRRRGVDSMTGRLPGMSERVWHAAVDSGQPRPIGDVRRAVDTLFDEFAHSVTVDPHAHAVLTRLREDGLRLALVSNASSYSVPILHGLGLPRRFDATVLSFEVGVLKPDPVIYVRASAALGLRPHACAFVGDGGDSELRGASALGMRTVLVDRRLRHSDEARADADAVVGDLAEVTDVVGRRSAPDARAGAGSGS